MLTSKQAKGTTLFNVFCFNSIAHLQGKNEVLTEPPFLKVLFVAKRGFKVETSKKTDAM